MIFIISNIQNARSQRNVNTDGENEKPSDKVSFVGFRKEMHL